MRRDLLNEPFCFVLAADIGLERLGMVPEPGGQRLGRLAAGAIIDGDLRTFADKGARDRRAEATAGTGGDDDLLVKRQAHFGCPSVAGHSA